MTPTPRRLLITVPAGLIFGVLIALTTGHGGMLGVGLVMGVGTGLAWSALTPSRPTSSAPSDSMES